MIQTAGARYILGEAPLKNEDGSSVNVLVNGAPAVRAGKLGFFCQKIPGSNTNGPVWSLDEVATTLNGQNTSITGRTWTPAWQTSPTYDFDGNLTSDGRWTYSWDADNRLSRMQQCAHRSILDEGVAGAPAQAGVSPATTGGTNQTTTAAVTAGVPHQRIDFVYDWQGRRVAKHVYSSANGSTWTFQSGRRFLYDGWNLIAEYTAASAAPGAALTLTASHTWGIDVSGTAQGAGGVGGLLASTLHDGASSQTFLPSFDGNGNISAWSDPGGALLTRTDYSPFGQVVARYRLGPPGDTRPDRLAFGFSTKYTDPESGLLYYGYRYLDPVPGRWLSRDPIGENGGVNLYGFVGNGGIGRVDVFGLNEVVVSGGCNANPGGWEIAGPIDGRPELPGLIARKIGEEFSINALYAVRHDANWKNFISAAEQEIIKRKKTLATGEHIEWFVEWTAYANRSNVDEGDVKKYLNEIKDIAKRHGVGLRFFGTKMEFIWKIHTSIGGRDYRAGSDKISRITYFGHGVPGAMILSPGWENTKGAVNNVGFSLDGDDIGMLNKAVFSKHAIGISCGCNSATESKDGGMSFRDAWKNHFGFEFYGVNGRTSYQTPESVVPEKGSQWIPFRPEGFR